VETVEDKGLLIGRWILRIRLRLLLAALIDLTDEIDLLQTPLLDDSG